MRKLAGSPVGPLRTLDIAGRTGNCSFGFATLRRRILLEQAVEETNARLSSDNFWPVDGKCRTFVAFQVRRRRWHYLPNCPLECRKRGIICPILELANLLLSDSSVGHGPQ